VTKRRKLVVAIAALVVALIACAVVAVHNPGVQRRVWRSVTAAIAESSNLQIEAGEVRLRALPARLVLRDLTVSIEGQKLLTVEEIRADWIWRKLAAQPHRIEKIFVRHPVFFGDALPSQGGSTENPQEIDPWGRFEIGSLEVSGGSATGDMADVRVMLDEVAMRAHLGIRSAGAAIEAGNLKLDRADRQLELGPLSLEAEASADGIVTVHKLEIMGAAASFTADGGLTTSPTMTGHFATDIQANLEAVAEWWDPNLVTGLAPAGRAHLVGDLELHADGSLTVELEHRGAPMSLAGYDVETLELSYSPMGPRVRVAGSEWGGAEVTIDQKGMTSIVAELDRAPIDRLLNFVAPRIAGVVRGPTTATGRVASTFSFPIDMDSLRGDVDLVVAWSEGRLAVRGSGSGRDWRIADLRAQLAGMTATAYGTIRPDRTLSAEAELEVADPAVAAAYLRPWFPDTALPDVGGGAITGTLGIEGTIEEPILHADLTWNEPMVVGRSFHSIAVSGAGNLEDLQWHTRIEVEEDAILEAQGTAEPLAKSIEGNWNFAIPDLARMVEVLTPDVDIALVGGLDGSGTLAWSQDDYRVHGRVEGRDLGAEGLTALQVATEFTVDPVELSIEEIKADVFGGSVEGRVKVPLTDLRTSIDGQISWREIDLTALPVSVPKAVTGKVSGRAQVAGTVSQPRGDLSVVWEAGGPHPLVDRLQLNVDLADGVVHAVLDDTKTRAGSISAQAEVPLGDVERPSWLWPHAPGGSVTAHFAADGFRFGPVAEMLAIDTLGSEITADIDAAIEWNPKAPDSPRMRVSARGLRIVHPTGELVADGPLIVTVDGRKIEIEPVALVGFDSRIDIEAAYDAGTDMIEASLDAFVSEKLSRVIPMPLRMRGPLKVTADLRLPVAETPSLEAVEGTFGLDLGDGSLVMRDPPVEIRGLKIEAALQDGRIDILDGSAEVNRGTVLMGGGWDPVSGQGLVFELQNVMLFFNGILTTWDGDLAVEPRDGAIAHVTGDLTLTGGLWDENFGLTSAILGSDEVELAADDPLYDISLDLSVRGRAGIRVDNNLGHFDVNWEVFRIDGNAAAPRLKGEARIAPGGVIGLGGSNVKVRRGSIEFTGDPAVDPIVEIVPESEVTLIGGESGTSTLDPTLMATRGLAQGLSSVLGFENETLRPAEIAVQTEKDPSVNFMVGQRINRNLALFLTTNLTDVQDRTAMIQGWRFPGLRGLVLQAYQETLDDNFGGNIFQRFTWGGSRADLGRPEVNRLRLEGDWPLSKKYLKKTTRLRRGQPYEPFLLFVASVRMERALAQNGYQNARITGLQEGDERSPTLVFHCDPGDPQFVRFVGDPLPRQIRAEATALYEPPPLESSSLEAMAGLVTRYLGLEGYPEAEVVAVREDDLIVVSVAKGQQVDVKGPFFDGLPPEIASAVGKQLGSANVIAAIASRPEQFERTITQRLASLGYLDARVLSVDVVRLTQNSAEVRISVDAGPRQRIDEVMVVGSDPLDLANPEDLGVRAGQPLDRTKLDLAARDWRDAYIEAGYRDARARAEARRDTDGRWTVQFELEPGALRRLRKVEFSGAKYASQRVLEKGLTIEDGEILTDAAVDQSANRIANFSPIDRVEVRTRPVGTSQVDVEFDVVEKPRWAAEVGAGWSTERGTSASFGIRDDDLFGRGVDLNLRGGWATTEHKLFLVGSLPPVPGGRVSLISTLGFSSGDAPDQPDLLTQEEYLASLEARYALANRVQVGVYYRWTDTRTFEKDPDPFFPIDTRNRLGTLGVRTVIDRFDNLFDPRRGYGLTSDLGWSSSAVGSDFNYLSWLSNFSLAVAPFSGTTWLQTARVGVAEPLKGENLIPDARFFAGGQASIRGFDLNSVGPVTVGLEGTLVPAGGGALFILNEELRIPLWSDLRFAVFTDIGQVWPSWRDADLELSVGAGAGLRWSTPIGLVWGDVAWPVANIGISSKKAKFYLGIGRTF
jgi:outer membrane protein assembly factor BamA